MVKVPLINEISRYTKIKYPLFKCKSCGFIRPNPLPYKDDDKLEIYDSPDNIKFYDKKKKKINRESKEYKYYFKHFRPYLELVKKYKIKGRALDIGCGAGHLMLCLKNNGFDTEGIEISPVLVSTLKKERCKVYCSEINDKKIKRNHYNLITFNQVLEHIEYPEKFIENVRTKLAERGYLILAVPYIYGLVPNILRSKWYGLGYGQHVNFFSKKSLEIMLERNGFEVSEFKVLIVDYAHPKFPKVLNLFAEFLSKIIVFLGLGDNLFVVAKKKEAKR